MDHYKAFIRAWYDFATQHEIAAVLGIDRRALQNMAAQLRRHGVYLPHRPSGKPGKARKPVKCGPEGWDELRRLSEMLRGQAEADRYRRQAV